jgi:hypothetical protein
MAARAKWISSEEISGGLVVTRFTRADVIAAKMYVH